MKIHSSVENLINKIGVLNTNDLASIENGNLGIYIPSFVENGEVKLLGEGQTQSENSLNIRIRNRFEEASKLGQAVAWVGSLTNADSDCEHPGTGPKNCKHCTTHGGPIINCTGHPESFQSPHELEAPELDYRKGLEEVQQNEKLLQTLARYGLGLSLLHGHNKKSEFTVLPNDYVSVIANGRTHFRKREEVDLDKSFVPNMWRLVDGQLLIAGGYSEI